MLSEIQPNISKYRDITLFVTGDAIARRADVVVRREIVSIVTNNVMSLYNIELGYIYIILNEVFTRSIMKNINYNINKKVILNMSKN